MKKHLGYLALLAMAAAPEPVAAATNYYFDLSLTGAPQWLGANHWSTTSASGPFDTNWVDNNVAIFSPTASRTIDLAGNTFLFGSGAGITNTSNDWSITLRSISGGPATLQFNGGTIRSGGSTTIHETTTLTGNLTLASGLLDLTKAPNAGVSKYSGTLTASGGILNLGPDRLSTSSHLSVTGATVYSSVAGTHSLGALQATGGNYYIGVTTASGIVDVSVQQLSGGVLNGNIQARTNNSANGLIHSFTVDQATNTTYNGNLLGHNSAGNGNLSYLSFSKSGSGTLSLGGNTITLLQGTTVSAGTLLIDGPPASGTRTFDNIAGGAGSAAITVKNGAALGGLSTVNVLNGRNVVIEQGGILLPGADGVVGRTNFDFGATGGFLDLTAAATETGWLKFDLGSNATPATTYDQLRLVSSHLGDVGLDIGTALLNFNDFAFNPLTGFGEGDYTLFALAGTAQIHGTLGTSLTGLISSEYQGTLFQSGNDLILSVVAVPEPGSTALMIGSGIVLLGWAQRTRRRRR